MVLGGRSFGKGNHSPNPSPGNKENPQAANYRSVELNMVKYKTTDGWSNQLKNSIYKEAYAVGGSEELLAQEVDHHHSSDPDVYPRAETKNSAEGSNPQVGGSERNQRKTKSRNEESSNEIDSFIQSEDVRQRRSPNPSNQIQRRYQRQKRPSQTPETKIQEPSVSGIQEAQVKLRGSRLPVRNEFFTGARRSESSFFNERLLKVMGSSTVDLPPGELKEKKFNGRCRLFVGNLPKDVTEDEFRKLFEKYGEVSEAYINREKNFAFIRLDYRTAAENASREMDGLVIGGKAIRVRLAPIGASVRVRNLSPYVTNELLELAFSVFGEVERAVVYADDRGNSLREGIVDFSRKGSAQSALRHCSENCFFLTSALKPVVLEQYEQLEETDGFSEKCIIRKTPDFYQSRELGPRFARPGSFEHEFGTRWKQIYDIYKQKTETLKKEMKLEEEKLEAQLQYAKYEHETEVLREQLRQRELDRERQKRECEIKEKQAEEIRAAAEESLRRQQEEFTRRILHQDQELRRRNLESTQFLQEMDFIPTGKETVPFDPVRAQINLDFGSGEPPLYLEDTQEREEFGSRRSFGWGRQEMGDMPIKRRRF